MPNGNHTRDSAVTIISLLVFLIFGSIFVVLWFDSHRRAVVAGQSETIREVRKHRIEAQRWRDDVRGWLDRMEAETGGNED